MDSANGNAIVAAILASIGVFSVLVVAYYVLIVVAYWKMFTKAGEPGWKSIIPIYHDYVMFKLVWKGGAAQFWIRVLFAVTGTICSATVNGEENEVMQMISGVCAILYAIWTVRFYIKMAHAYGKGTGLGILALFFPNVMTLYFGFASSATYQGPQD